MKQKYAAKRKILIILLFFLIASANAEILPDSMTYPIVAIYKIDNNGHMLAHGTGFLVMNEQFGDSSEPLGYLITCAHILQGRNLVIVKTKSIDKIKQIIAFIPYILPLVQNDSTLWTANPNYDIAVCNFPPNDSLSQRIFPCSKSIFMDMSIALNYSNTQIGQEILFYGFPLGIGTNNEPIPLIRPGMVSYKENGVYLIDAQVFGGSSGSAVFTKPLIDIAGNFIEDTEKLIGIVSGHKTASIRGLPLEENAGLGEVFSKDLILETIQLHRERKIPYKIFKQK